MLFGEILIKVSDSHPDLGHLHQLLMEQTLEKPLCFMILMEVTELDLKIKKKLQTD
jgi:hypothetical protein